MYFGSISNMAASGTLLFQRGGVREMTETKHKFDSSWTSILFFYVTFNIFSLYRMHMTFKKTFKCITNASLLQRFGNFCLILNYDLT